MAERSKHQAKVIRNYYQNRGPIAVQRLQELITDLYLSEGKKREKHWKNAATHLAALGVKKPRIEYLIQQDKPELIADLIKDFMKER
jgi:hypothetical protein